MWSWCNSWKKPTGSATRGFSPWDHQPKPLISHLTLELIIQTLESLRVLLIGFFVETYPFRTSELIIAPKHLDLVFDCRSHASSSRAKKNQPSATWFIHQWQLQIPGIPGVPGAGHLGSSMHPSEYPGPKLLSSFGLSSSGSSWCHG